MLLTLAHIGSAPGSKDKFEPLIRVYLDRCEAFAKSKSEVFRSEADFLDWLDRQKGRTPATTILLDSRGKLLSSEKFAAWIGEKRDLGAQHLVFAIGPADGWSPSTRERAHLLLSLGPMTLAHALARLVAAEQIYRAFTILTGHPYHSGH